MDATLRGNLPARRYNGLITLARGTAWGLIGGLVGTAVMDLILMGALSVVGQPPLACFSLVGATVARFFLTLGIELAGGVPAGVATHYLVGPLVGALFGAAAARVAAFRVNTLMKCVLLAVLYVEILSQPLLALTPILLKMKLSETVEWYGGSFLMHMIWGVILGAIVFARGPIAAGLREPAPAQGALSGSGR